MAYDFPSPPLTVGQVYPVSPTTGQSQYTWDGEKWTMGMSGPVTPPSSAPVLTILTDDEDDTPEFSFAADFTIDDVVRYQWDNVNTFDSGAFDEATNAIDASEDAALILGFSADPLADGTWYFRARVERGATIFNWSNIQTVTLAGVVPPTYTPALKFNDARNSMYL